MSETDEFVYQALNRPGNSIRLVTLWAGQFSEDVYVSITHENFSDGDREPYECLSYTWGPKPPAQVKIYICQDPPPSGNNVDGMQFLYIRPNLLTALKHMRLPDAHRKIWIDAICIDQQNVAEKGLEVARMGLIFSKAARVLVWLGEEDENTSIALETVARLSEGVELTPDRRNCIVAPASEAEAVVNCIEKSAITLQHWKALARLIQRPWFTRLWIRQEVQMASKVLLKCGQTEIHWGKLEKTIIFIEHNVSRAYIGTKDLLYCRSLFPYSGSDNLSYILHRSSKCGFSDARDLIYANLSTSSKLKALEIKPDYTLTAAEVYKDMVCRYIQRYQNLEPLRWCDIESLLQGSKSFVPNYARAKPESQLFSKYAHAGSRQSFTNTESGNIIVKGRILATIQITSEIRKPIARSTQVGNNARDIIEAFHHWEPEGLMTSKKYPQGGSLLEAFVLLLSNGFCKETYHLSHLPTVQESKESFLAAVWSGGDLNLITHHRFKAYVGELKSDRRCEVFFQTAEGYLGTSPVHIQEGDVVSVLAGASVPIVLRPVVDHPESYQVVGPCYLQGVMFGEGFLGPLPEGWLCVTRDKQRWVFQEQGSGKMTREDPRLWPLPLHWQAHVCDFDDDKGPCDGSCELSSDKTVYSADRWFSNTQSKEKSEDPRLDVQGLEKGGITLQTLTLV